MDELKVTENIILLTLKELNISKSPGPDEIGARLLTELSPAPSQTGAIPPNFDQIFHFGNRSVPCYLRLLHGCLSLQANCSLFP